MSSNPAAEELQEVAVSSIKKHPKNPRIHFTEGEMEKLMDSIDEQGVLVPILVYRKGKSYILVDGERRWRSASELGLDTIPAIVSAPKSEKEHLIQMFNIHMVREPWSNMPTAWALERLIEELGTDEMDALQEASGLAPEQIRRLTHALSLPKKYQKHIDSGAIPLNFFWELERNVIAPLTKKRPAVWGGFKSGEVLKSFVDKRLAGTLTDTVSLRKVSPIIKVAADEAGSPEGESTLDDVIVDLVRNANTTIETAYENSVEMAVEADKLGRKSDNLIKGFQRLWDKAEEDEEQKELKALAKSLINGIKDVLAS